MTNKERLRVLNNAELAKRLLRTPCEFCIYKNQRCPRTNCEEHIEEWLEREA